MLLMFLVYYFGGGLIDVDVADIPVSRGVTIGLGALVFGWLVYDLAVRSPLSKSEVAFAGFSLVAISAVSWGLMHIFSGRAAYIHVGAILGTIMTANVWLRILPAQRKLIAAVAAGRSFDAALSSQAKLRSKHNTFLAVPVVFIMLSNHYPVATYGNPCSWQILVVLVLVGWVAAKLVRSA